jgi:hypothetical protein
MFGLSIEKNEMGGACGMYGGGEICITEFWWGNLIERTHGRPRRRYVNNTIKMYLKSV